MMLQVPTLRQLEYIVSVAELRHFGRAALACAVSQPALSKQIQEAEQLLGVVIFERARPKIRLTPMGRVRGEKAQQVWSEAQELVQVSARLRGELAGQLRLGVIPTVAPYLLPPLLAAFREEERRLQLILQEGMSYPLLEELRAGRLDLVLLALPIRHKGLEVLPLFEEPFVLAAPVGHGLATRGALAPSELLGDELLLMAEGHCLRDHALDVCGTVAGEDMAIQATSMTTLALMVRSGLGATLMPATALAHEMAGADDVCLRAFAKGSPHRTIGLIWRPTAVHVELFQLIGERLRAMVPQLQRSLPQGIEGPSPTFKLCPTTAPQR